MGYGLLKLLKLRQSDQFLSRDFRQSCEGHSDDGVAVEHATLSGNHADYLDHFLFHVKLDSWHVPIGHRPKAGVVKDRSLAVSAEVFERSLLRHDVYQASARYVYTGIPYGNKTL